MKYWIHFSLACLGTAYLVIIAVAFFLFWPVKTLVVNNFSDANPIKITTPIVHPGDPLGYQLDYCKYTDSPNTVHRTLIDGQVITLTDTPGRLPTGCHIVTVQTAIVPETINPGSYYLDVVVEYKINILRSEYIHYHTTYFEVVKGGKEATSTGENIIITK